MRERASGTEKHGIPSVPFACESLDARAPADHDARCAARGRGDRRGQRLDPAAGADRWCNSLSLAIVGLPFDDLGAAGHWLAGGSIVYFFEYSYEITALRPSTG